MSKDIAPEVSKIVVRLDKEDGELIGFYANVREDGYMCVTASEGHGDYGNSYFNETTQPSESQIKEFEDWYSHNVGPVKIVRRRNF